MFTSQSSRTNCWWSKWSHTFMGSSFWSQWAISMLFLFIYIWKCYIYFQDPKKGDSEIKFWQFFWFFKNLLHISIKIFMYTYIILYTTCDLCKKFTKSTKEKCLKIRHIRVILTWFCYLNLFIIDTRSWIFNSGHCDRSGWHLHGGSK